jgi:A/G-specific adenine glycosylase
VAADPKTPIQPWELCATPLARFRTALLEWFAQSKRDLPWRRTKDAYRVWISEIMLQQTRVAAVIPYYERFLDRFPDVRALARARTESVLQHWAGLGYYSRARNLQGAARQIVAKHKGEFPRGAEAALDLAGIGGYTAAAVLSIAYDQPLAALDGNVARVLARLGAIRGDLRKPERWQELSQAAGRLLARERPGDWNQAMMELGATICTPGAPRCLICPVAGYCRARALGVAAEIPEKRRKRATVEVNLAVAVFRDADGQTLVVRPAKETVAAGVSSRMDRHGQDLFSRMWQFPAVALPGTKDRRLKDRAQSPLHVLRDHLRHEWRISAKALFTNTQELPPIRHTVTFREVTLLPFLMRVARLPHLSGSRTVPLDAIQHSPVSSATKKIAAAALHSL